MPNANQILALVKSHLEGDDKRFKEVAMQIAAVEARSGHTILSRSIADLIKSNTGARLVRSLAPLNMDVSEYVLSVDNSYRLSDLICGEMIKSKISRIIKEYIHRDLLYQNNLSNRNKILLAGPSGTGKTMTASILANELHLPLYVVRMEKVITKYMGETSLKLSKIFDLISNVRGIYLFDEFETFNICEVRDPIIKDNDFMLENKIPLSEENVHPMYNKVDWYEFVWSDTALKVRDVLIEGIKCFNYYNTKDK